jgi:diaminopimelate decarboxylase
VINDRLDRLKNAFPDDALHAIPIKTNPLFFILQNIVSRGLGLEAASMEEVLLAINAGTEASRIVFDSPAKTRQEILHLRDHCRGIRINADSLDELERYPKRDSGFRVSLRINPNVGTDNLTS